MGSALQRLEILLIGLVLVIAGAVVAILLIVRPSTPTAVVPASPPPIATMTSGCAHANDYRYGDRHIRVDARTYRHCRASVSARTNQRATERLRRHCPAQR